MFKDARHHYLLSAEIDVEVVQVPTPGGVPMYAIEYTRALGSNELDEQKATYGEKIFKQERGNRIKHITPCCVYNLTHISV